MRRFVLLFVSGCQLLARLDQPLDASATDAIETSAASPYATEVLRDAPILYYRFDEKSGVTCKDASGHGNDGVLGGTFSRVLSAVGDANDGAIDFNPSGQLPLSEKFDYGLGATYTLEAWIKLNAQGNLIDNIRDVSPNNRFGVTIYFDTPDSGSQFPIGFEKWSGNNLISFVHDTSAITFKQFEHFVLVSDAGTPKLVIDGRIIGGYVKSGVMAWMPASLLIHYDGQIDELAIYDHVVPDDRLAIHYQRGHR